MAEAKKISLLPFFRDLKQSVNIIWKAGKSLVIANVMLSAIQAFMPVATLFFIKQIIEAITAQPIKPVDKLLWAIGGFTIAQFILAATAQVAGYISVRQEQRVTDHMSLLVLNKAVAVGMPYYENAEFHDTLHLAQIQSQYRAGQLLGYLNALLLNTLSLLFLSGLFVVIAWQYALIFIAVSLPLSFVKWYYSYKITGIEKKYIPHERESNYLYSILTGAGFAKEIRAFGTAGYFISKYTTIREYIYKGKKAVHLRLTWYSIAAQALEAVIVAAVFIALGKQVYSSALSVGVFVLYLQGFQRLQSTSKNFLQSLIQILQHRLFLKDIFKFLAIETQPGSLAIQPFPTLRKGLTVKGLSFTYPNAGKETLSNISLTCAPGNIVAIVGQNGSGKSTLVKLLTRMYPAEKGTLFLDNEDITTITLDDFRNNSVALFQDYEKYFLTVNDNISFTGERADQQKVTEAAQNANAHAFISKLPEAYSTRLGHAFRQSVPLSGGQWQMLAFARIFYKDAPFVVLDEPTSSIDAIAENRIYENLRKMAKNKVVILISHRLYNLRIADKIYVMKEGAIVEEGTYDELLAKDSYFRELFNSQMV